MNKKCAKCGIDEKQALGILDLCRHRMEEQWVSAWVEEEPQKADDRPWEEEFEDIVELGIMCASDPNGDRNEKSVAELKGYLKKFIGEVVSESLRRAAEKGAFMLVVNRHGSGYLYSDRSTFDPANGGTYEEWRLVAAEAYNPPLDEAAESITNNKSVE